MTEKILVDELELKNIANLAKEKISEIRGTFVSLDGELQDISRKLLNLLNEEWNIPEAAVNRIGEIEIQLWHAIKTLGVHKENTEFHL